MIKVIIIVLGICIISAVIITKIIDFIQEAIRLSDLYETMDPPKYYSCIELTADQYILFHELYPKNFLLKETINRKNLIYISDKSYKEFERKKKEYISSYFYFWNTPEPNSEYIRLKTPEEYDKVYKYFKNKKEQEEKAKQCAVQAEFLKEMREKTAKEVEKASNTIKTAEDVFKTILNRTEKS